MKAFKISVLIMISMNLVLGCRSSAEKFDDDLEKSKDQKRETFSKSTKLVPFVQSAISDAYKDLKDLVDYFRNQLDKEHNNDPLKISLFKKDSSDFKLNLKLLPYQLLESDRVHNIYIALGHDFKLISALVKILEQLDLRANTNSNIDVKIAFLLLFNLEQVAHLTFLFKDSLSNKSLNKIKNSKIVTIDDITNITSSLFLFINQRRELMQDISVVITEASVVRNNRRAMEMHLKKIVQDGEIKDKLKNLRELIRSIDNLIVRVT